MTRDLRLLRFLNRSAERLPRPTLDPQAILAFVAAREGGTVPDTHWHEPFRLLCHDLETHAALSPVGRIMANGQLVGLLRARCRLSRLLERHPEISEEPVARPIIVMGPMRVGSTRVQRLLGRDPRFAVTRLFETLFPVPVRGGNARRIAAAAAVHRTLRTLNPALQQVHPSGPLMADEEFGYLSFAFHSGQFGVQWNVPGFLAAERARDLRPVAEELRLLLQVNGWARGGTGGRRWVLKCPAYSGMAEALLHAFPDASLLCLERDTAAVVASSASLVFEQRRVHSDAVDRHAIGAEWLERTAGRAHALAAFRASHPQVPALDLGYGEMDEDWRAAMARVYAFLDLPLTRPVEARMAGFLARSRAHAGHRYRLEDFGLGEAAIRRAMTAPGDFAQEGCGGDALLASAAARS